MQYNQAMQQHIADFKKHVTEIAQNPDFIHHQWFVTWHLEVVEKIAFELLQYYPEADRDLVEVMVWLHDYGKILDFDNEAATTLQAGPQKLREIGFDQAFADTAIKYIELLDKKMEIDIRQTPIEVQIVSSADGCSHLTGPFMQLYWYENPQKPYQQLMTGNRNKTTTDWQRKIVLPEAQAAFEQRFQLVLEQNGELPERFITSAAA